MHVDELLHLRSLLIVNSELAHSRSTIWSRPVQMDLAALSVCADNPTPPTAGASCQHVPTAHAQHTLPNWESTDETPHVATQLHTAAVRIFTTQVQRSAHDSTAPEAALDVQAAGAGVLVTPRSHSAPSRWAQAAASATAAATSLPGAAFRESATLRASFWLCRNCDLAWAVGGAAGRVCPECHVARVDMQLQAGPTELAHVRELVQSSLYGRGLAFANRNEQPIGPPPAAFANPHTPDFAETVRSATLRLLGPGVTLSGGRTDALMTFESWLLLMYDAEFSVYAHTPRTRDSHHPHWSRTRHSHHPHSGRTHLLNCSMRLPPSSLEPHSTLAPSILGSDTRLPPSLPSAQHSLYTCSTVA